MKSMAKACQWDYLKESISINVCSKRHSEKVYKDSSSYFEGHCKCFYMDLEV